MKKVLNYTLFSIIIIFIYIANVSAECSYQERKDMLKVSKNVDISLEPVEVTEEEGEYDFKFNIVGLKDDIFIKYYNTNNGVENYIMYKDLKDGIYSFVDENSFMIYNYKFVFYSNNNNCLGYELNTKTIKKPMYNIYSENINCKNPANESFKYCKKFLEKDYKLDLNKFNVAITDYNLSKVTEEELQENDSKKNYILPVSLGVFALLIIGVIIYYVNKKRKEL